MFQVNYIRIWRISTDSYATIKLPEEMDFEKAMDWGEKEFPTFMICSGCPTNPDEIIG